MALTKVSGNIIQDNVTIVGVLTATKLSAPNMTIGIGSTASFTADISGDMRIQDGYKMRFGGTSVSSNYYIQYNSTTNSLDFVSG
jgi:hypothetical protein